MVINVQKKNFLSNYFLGFFRFKPNYFFGFFQFLSNYFLGFFQFSIFAA